MSKQVLNAVIQQVYPVTDNTKRFIISCVDLSVFPFIPGQFITIHFTINGKKINRSYSIASPPSHTNSFELVISRKAEGAVSDYIWENFKSGTSLSISQPQGKFSLPSKQETDLCFIATGTGIAPLRSMILSLLNQKGYSHQIYLIFGVRMAKDILYREAFENLAQTNKNFHFIPVLSRETNPEWEGEKGYVHAVYASLFAHLPPMTFYLCGWKEMLREATQNLLTMGYKKSDIHFESYG